MVSIWMLVSLRNVMQIVFNVLLKVIIIVQCANWVLTAIIHPLEHANLVLKIVSLVQIQWDVMLVDSVMFTIQFFKNVSNVFQDAQLANTIKFTNAVNVGLDMNL